ncbi:carbon monoxide dehydrogenase [Iodidimonas gelatinilytica]|uniref:Carbon monoxide dehydrogenase n=1 Tax=Iodidimonas gelatinilytica TaxID=1236966 RepID=A0A5A7MQT4_9PROT|nr:(2Fe-2S)-binding protein [Iodidimonas gelatinilytica]GEQ97984.1 carbon monoxide dehydrogenase [Iodidimonas gelatinilytica]
MALSINLTVNGKAVTKTVEPTCLLVDFLRDDLQLTGTHVGCDTSQCGACTIHLDGQPVKACTILAVQADGAEILTIEGLAPEGELHPMQAAFAQHHGLQCGFCTPGMVMTGIGIARQHPDADEATIRRELEGNLCRCTGYQNIMKAVVAGTRLMAESEG